MRVGCKNKFLKRLNAVGDLVFPKRKELIGVLGEEFSDSIKDFIENTFNLNKVPFFVLKEEIKKLQNMAKKFTLDTQTFTSCRLNLSKCWDEVKIAERNYKKEKIQSKDYVDKVLEKIKKLKEICESNPEDENIEKEQKEIYNFMKTLDLRKEDIKFLKHKIKDAKSSIYKKQQKEKEHKIKVESEKENVQKERLENIKKTITSLLDNPQLSIDELNLEKNQIEKDLESLNPAKFERLILEKQIGTLYHLIEDKKEKIQLNSTEDLNDILNICKQKKQRKQDLRVHLDNLNKELASSGLDFEKAMIYRNLIDLGKQWLASLEMSIEEIEEKISDLSN
jgi:hypothetical protein